MSERDALLAAVLAAPDDDLARLVFADWLEETARPAAIARARFIRLQIELANTSPDTATYPQHNFDLADEIDSLAVRWMRSWLTEFPPQVARAVWSQRLGAGAFRRGFLDGVRLSPKMFLATAPALFAAAPITSLHLHGEYSDGKMTALFTSPHLHKLHAVRLSGGWCGDRIARRLAKCPDLGAVRELDLSGCWLSDHGALDLARSPALARLSVLRVCRNRLTGFGVYMLASASTLSPLARFDAAENPGVRAPRW